MWIFLNNAFVSIVRHREQPDILLVRARREGDIERAIPGAVSEETQYADYRYRAPVSAEVVAQAISRQVRDIDYDNFKNSIEDPGYHAACSSVWGDMLRLQKGVGRYAK